MFDKFVAGLLTSYLGEYFENIDTQQVKVSVWKGNVKLRNIKVRRDALRFWSLPFCVSHGLIDELHVQIPWTRLASESVVIQLKKVVLVVEDKVEVGYDAERLRTEEHMRKQRALDAAEEAMLAEWRERLNARMTGGGQLATPLDAATSAHVNTADSAATGNNDDTFSARLKANILNNIRVEVQGFELCFQAPAGERESRHASASPPYVSLSLDNLKTYACNERYLPDFAGVKLKLLHKALDVKGIRIATSPLHDSGLSGSSRPSQIISPFDAFVKLQYQPIPFESTIPTYLCAIRVEEVHTKLNEQQWHLLVSMLRHLWTGADMLDVYTRYHPGQADGRPTRSPRQWWRYAIQAVMHEGRRTRQKARGLRFSWEEYVAMKRKRERYTGLYMRDRRDLFRATGWLKELTAEERTALSQLERDLPLTTLSVARRTALDRVDMEREEYNRVTLEKRRQKMEQQQQRLGEPDEVSAPQHKPPQTPQPPQYSGWFSRWWSSGNAASGTQLSTSTSGHVDRSSLFGELSDADRAEMRQVVELMSAARWTQMQRLAIAKEFGLSDEEVQELSQDASSAGTRRASSPLPSPRTGSTHDAVAHPKQRDGEQQENLWCKCLFQFVSSSVELYSNHVSVRGSPTGRPVPQVPLLTMRMDGLSIGTIVTTGGDADGWLVMHSYAVSAENGVRVLQRRWEDTDRVCARAPSPTRGTAVTSSMEPPLAPGDTQVVPLTARAVAEAGIREALNETLAEVLRVASVSFPHLGQQLAQKATLTVAFGKHLQHQSSPVMHSPHERPQANRSPTSMSPGLLTVAAEAATAAASLMPYDVSVNVAPIDVRLHVPLLENLTSFFIKGATATPTNEFIGTRDDESDCSENSAGIKLKDSQTVIPGAHGGASEGCRTVETAASPTMLDLLLPDEPTRLTAAEERDVRDSAARLQSLRQRTERSWQLSWRLSLSRVCIYVADGTAERARGMVPAASRAASPTAEHQESPLRRLADPTAPHRGGTQQTASHPPCASAEQATAIRFDGLVLANDPKAILARRARAAAAAVEVTGGGANAERDGAPTSACPFGSADDDWVDTFRATIASLSVDCRLRETYEPPPKRELATEDAASEASSAAFRSAVSFSQAPGTSVADTFESEGTWHHILHPVHFRLVAQKSLLGRRQVKYPALSMSFETVTEVADRKASPATAPDGASSVHLHLSWTRAQLFVVASSLSYVTDFFRRVQRRLLLVKQRVLQDAGSGLPGGGSDARGCQSRTFAVHVASLDRAFLCEDDGDGENAVLSRQQQYYKTYSLESFEQRTASADDRQVVEVLPGSLVVYHRQRSTYPKYFMELVTDHVHTTVNKDTLTLDVYVEAGGSPHTECRKGALAAKRFLCEALGVPTSALRNVSFFSRFVQDWVKARASVASAASGADTELITRVLESLKTWERASHTVPCHHARFTCRSAAQLDAMHRAIQRACLPFGRYTPSADDLAAFKTASMPNTLQGFRMLQLSVKADSANIDLLDETNERSPRSLHPEVPPLQHRVALAPFDAAYEQFLASQVYTCVTDSFTLNAEASPCSPTDEGHTGEKLKVSDALSLTQVAGAKQERRPIVLRTESVARPHPLAALKRTTLAADTACLSVKLTTALLNAMEHMWDSSGILSDRVFGHSVAHCTPFIVDHPPCTEDGSSPSLDAVREAERRWQLGASKGALWLNMAAIRAARFHVEVFYPSDRHEMASAEGSRSIKLTQPDKPMLTLHSTDALIRWKQCAAENVTNLVLSAPTIEGGYQSTPSQSDEGRTDKDTVILSNTPLHPVLWPAPAAPPQASKLEVTFRSDSAAPTISFSDFLTVSTGQAFASSPPHVKEEQPMYRGFRFTQHLGVSVENVHSVYWNPQLMALFELGSRGLISRMATITLREGFFLPPPGVAGSTDDVVTNLPPWPRQDEPGPACEWSGLEKQVTMRNAIVHLPTSSKELPSSPGQLPPLVAQVEKFVFRDDLDVVSAPECGSSALMMRATMNVQRLTLTRQSTETQTEGDDALHMMAPLLGPIGVNLFTTNPVFRPPTTRSVAPDKAMEIAFDAELPAVVRGSLEDLELLLRLPHANYLEASWSPAFVTPRPGAEVDPFASCLVHTYMLEQHTHRLSNTYRITIPSTLAVVLETQFSSVNSARPVTRKRNHAYDPIVRTAMCLEGLKANLRLHCGGAVEVTCAFESFTVLDLSDLTVAQALPVELLTCQESKERAILHLCGDDKSGTTTPGLQLTFSSDTPPDESSGQLSTCKHHNLRAVFGAVHVLLVPRFFFNFRDTFLGLHLRNAIGPLLGWPVHVPGGASCAPAGGQGPQDHRALPHTDNRSTPTMHVEAVFGAIYVSMPRVEESLQTKGERLSQLVPFFLSAVNAVRITFKETADGQGSSERKTDFSVIVDSVDRIGLFVLPSEQDDRSEGTEDSHAPIAVFRPLVVHAPPLHTSAASSSGEAAHPCWQSPATSSTAPLRSDVSTARTTNLLDELFADVAVPADTTASPTRKEKEDEVSTSDAHHECVENRAPAGPWFSFELSSTKGAHARLASTWLVLPRRTEVDVVVDLWGQGGFLKLPLLAQFREERESAMAAVTEAVATPVSASWVSRAFLNGASSSFVCDRPTIAIPDQGTNPATLHDIQHGLLLNFGDDVSCTYVRVSGGHEDVATTERDHHVSVLLPNMHLCTVSHPEDRFIEPFTIHINFTARTESDVKQLDVHLSELIMEVEQRYYEMLLQTLVKQLVDSKGALRAARRGSRRIKAGIERRQSGASDSGDLALLPDSVADDAAGLAEYLFALSDVGGEARNEDTANKEDGEKGSGAEEVGAGKSLFYEFLVHRCLQNADRQTSQKLRVFLCMEGLRGCVTHEGTSVEFHHGAVNALVRTSVLAKEIRKSCDAEPEETSAAPHSRSRFASPTVLRVSHMHAVDSLGENTDHTFHIHETREAVIHVPAIHVGVSGKKPLFSLAAQPSTDGTPLDVSALSTADSRESPLERSTSERILEADLAELVAQTSKRRDGAAHSPTGTGRAGTILSVKTNLEESISCDMGTLSFDLEASSVSAAVLALYKPYAEIVLPAYQLREVKEFDRDVTLTEDLVLTSRAKLHISNKRQNHITINAAGHAIHFDPEGNAGSTALLILDEGLTLRVMNARVFLYGKDLEYYTHAGNGSYVLLDRRTSVLQVEAASASGSAHVHAGKHLNSRFEPTSTTTTTTGSPGHQPPLLDELFTNRPTTTSSERQPRCIEQPAGKVPAAHTLFHVESDRSSFRKVMGSGRLCIVLPEPSQGGGRNANMGVSVGSCPSTGASLVLSSAMNACVVDHTSFPAVTPAGASATATSQRGKGITDRRATIDLKEVSVQNVRVHHGTLRDQTDLFVRWGLKVVLTEEDIGGDRSRDMHPGSASPGVDRASSSLPPPVHKTKRTDILAHTGVEMHLRYGDLLLCTRALRHAAESLRFALGNVDASAFTALFSSNTTAASQALPDSRRSLPGRVPPAEGEGSQTPAHGHGTSTTSEIATYSLSLPYVSIWIVNNSDTGFSEPLFHLRLDNISTPLWETSSITTKLQVSFSLLADFYDVATSTWSPVLDQVPISAMLKTRANRTLEDVYERRGITKVGVRVGDVKTYVSPALLQCVQRLLQLRDKYVQNELRDMLEHDRFEDYVRLPQRLSNNEKVPYHAFHVIQDVGNVDWVLGPVQSKDLWEHLGDAPLPHDATALDGHRTLSYRDSFEFNFPRINGKELSRSQQCVMVAYKGHEETVPCDSPSRGDVALVNVSSRGRCCLSLGPTIVRDHVLVDVKVHHGHRVITLRTNIQLVNDLSFPVEVMGPKQHSQDANEFERLGLLEPRSARNLPIEWMRSRATFRPLVPLPLATSNRETTYGEPASLGVAFDSLPELKGETFLCMCPTANAPAGAARQDGTLLAKGSDFEIRQSFQRAVYFLLKISSLRSVAPSSRSAQQAASMGDCTVRITAPFYLTNGLGVPINVTFMTQTTIAGKKLGLFDLSPETYVFHAVASVNINPGERYGVTEVDPFQDVRIDVSLAQTNGGTIGRNGRVRGQPQFQPALIFSPRSEGKCNRRFTIMSNHPSHPQSPNTFSSLVVNLSYTENEVTLWVPYWIVNQTPHVLQFCDGCEEPRPLIAGLVSHHHDGVQPSATTPFLYNSDRAERLGEKAHLYVRVGHDFAVSEGEPSAPGLRWSRWSESIEIARIRDAGSVSCALATSVLSTLSYSVELGLGEAASTRVITFRPRWVVLNRTPYPLDFRQSRKAVLQAPRDSHEGVASRTPAHGDRATADTIVPGSCQVLDLIAPVPRVVERTATTNDAARRTVAPVYLQVRYATDPRDDVSQIGCSDRPATSTPSLIANCVWSSDFRIDTIGDHTFNVQYEGLVPMSEYWPQERAGVEPTALPPLRPESIVDRNGELYVRRIEADVLHVSCYRAGSLTYVDISKAQQPPYVIENRTEYMVFVKQYDARDGGRVTSRGATAVYPKTTKQYTWEAPDGPPRMHLWAVNGHGSTQHDNDGHHRARLPSVHINFDPREVVCNPDQFQQEIDVCADRNVPNETNVLFVRVRGVHGVSYAISITEEPTVDAYRTLPYKQYFYQVDIQALYTALLAESDGDRISRSDVVALCTVKPLLIGFAQGGVSGSGQGRVRDVQRFDIQTRTLQLDDERRGAKEKVVLQLIDTAGATTVKWERTLLRTTPLVYCPVASVGIAPVELHVEDSFISAALALREALHSAWIGTAGERAGTAEHRVSSAPNREELGSHVVTPKKADALRQTRDAIIAHALLDNQVSSPSSLDSRTQVELYSSDTALARAVNRVLRLSGGGRPAAGGQALIECKWVGEALEKAADALPDTVTSGPPAAAGSTGPTTQTQPSSVLQNAAAAPPPRRRRKRQEKSEWYLRTVLIGRLLLEKLYVTVSLYRSPGAANDPLRKPLGVMSLLVRSIKDAKLDWPRVDQRNVCETVWMLWTRYYAHYKQRMQDQAPNLVHIAGLSTMRGFVSDLLTDYFTAEDLSAGGHGGSSTQEVVPPLKKDRVGRRREAQLSLDTKALSASSTQTNPSDKATTAVMPTGATGTSVVILRGHPTASVQTDAPGCSRAAPRSVTVQGNVLRLTDVALRYPWTVFAGAASAEETRQFGAVAVGHALRAQTSIPVYDICRDMLSCDEVLRRAQHQQQRQPQRLMTAGVCTRCAEVEAMLALQRFSASASSDVDGSAPLFHPRDGSLTWPEFLHHISWNEFLRYCTDDEVMQYRSAMVASLIGTDRHVIRLSG